MTAPQLIDIGKIIPNPHNPRIIRDEKFAKLVKSVKEFPEMTSLRPIIVNEQMQILGGNMRYRAMKEAGMKKVPCLIASLSTDKQREFIIKDNVGFGEWDWSLLANEWEANDLEDWGVNIQWANGHEANELGVDDLDLDEEFDPIGTSKGLQHVVFIFDGKEEAESYLHNLGVVFIKRNMAWQVNLSTRSTS